MFTHQASTRTLTSAIVATLIAAGASLPAEARGLTQTYPIPSPVPSNGGGTDGCWQANQQLYGGYRLSFCLSDSHGGSYHISGRGLDCRGGLAWEKNWWGDTQIALRQTSCGHGYDWSADSFTCQNKGGWNSNANKERINMMPIPSGGLSCNYLPITWGTPWSTFQASRT